MFKFVFKLIKGFVDGFLDNSKKYVVARAENFGGTVKNGVGDFALAVKDKASVAGNFITTKAGDIRTGVTANMDKPVVANRKTIILAFLVAILGGVVIGMLISPRKSIALGSYNNLKNDEEENEEDADKKKCNKKKCCGKKCKA